MMKFNFNSTEKIIVVTGASRGIGKEIVIQWAQNEKNFIVALSRNKSALDAQFGSMKNVFCGFIDLSSDDLQEKLTAIFEEIPTIDILINNAGILIKKPFLELSKEELWKSYQTNAIGTILLTQQLVSKMLEKGGHIVNISTMGAVQGSVKFSGLIAYSTSKSAIANFTELFAEEFKSTSVRMNCLCLGAVQTAMFSEAFPGLTAPHSPKEIAEFIITFAETGNQYFNGKIIPVSDSTP